MNELTKIQRDELQKYLEDRREWAARKAEKKREREAEIKEYAARLIRDL